MRVPEVGVEATNTILKIWYLILILKKTFIWLSKKGIFRIHYNTDLIFKKNKVEARCNCPLKEEWCKHAVAVALKAIDEHAYEDWLETKFGMEFDFPDENTALTEAPQGNYIFHFNSKRKANFSLY